MQKSFPIYLIWFQIYPRSKSNIPIEALALHRAKGVKIPNLTEDCNTSTSLHHKGMVHDFEASNIHCLYEM